MSSKRRPTTSAQPARGVTAAKELRSQPTRDRILAQARRLFAEEGYERTTIRTVAAAADINPSLVLRYYGSKEGLFAAAADFDLEIPNLQGVPRAELGRTLVRHLLARWEAHGHDLPALVRVAVTHESARARMLQLLAEQVAPVIAQVCEPERVATVVGLTSIQMLGLAFTRFVVRLPPVVALPEEVLIEHIGAAIQAYLTQA